MLAAALARAPPRTLNGPAGSRRSILPRAVCLSPNNSRYTPGPRGVGGPLTHLHHGRRRGRSRNLSDAHRRTLAHDARLSSLPTEAERELAALWRLEADVNNGAYLQFVCNWGRESHAYASQALKKIGARRMAEIIDQCQALVDEHAAGELPPFPEFRATLPENVVRRI